MKKLIPVVCALITLHLTAFAQKINYQSNIQEALSKAKQTQKPLFVLIGLPTVPPSISKNQPAANNGLEEGKAATFYNKNFINVKISLSDSAYSTFKKLYPIKTDSYPTHLFLDSDGEIIYRGPSVMMSSPAFYLTMANDALKATASGKTFSYYKHLQQQGSLTQNQLKEFITLKEKLGLFDNQLLIDEYVNNLPVKALNDYQEVLFILRAGPLAYGKTYNLAYTNRKIVDSIYKTEPLELRKEINNNIIVNTRNEAIRKKDAAIARQLSQFVIGTWSKDFRRGAKASQEELLYYYSTVKDTANYYSQATYFYDNYYMRVSVDSINKMRQNAVEANRLQTIERMKQVNPSIPFNKSSMPVSGTHIVMRTGVVTTIATGGPVMSDVPTTLNNAAYTFYRLGTHNTTNLTKALLWSKRSIELSPNNFAFYDTIAHLLYRLDFYDEAIFNQKKAIELAKRNPMAVNVNIDPLKKELAKMQEKSL
ncbi:hypothetical protein [Mucilaginibacter sp. CSA2-8R]|uniref:hypothetical protein n=1 Tax=Mucilaginibacter sp. CSA2-8R TaxID=3141542 RepID=UPI00315C7AFE